MAFVVNNTYDSNVASAPTAFTPGINHVVNYFETYFISAVTINIDSGWAEVGAQPVETDALGQNVSNLAADSGNTNLDNFAANPGEDFGNLVNSAGNDAVPAIGLSGVLDADSSADIAILDAVQPAQNTNGVVVSSLNSTQDGSGNNADLSGASNFYPAGMPQIVITASMVALSSADVANVGTTMTLYGSTTAFGTATLQSDGSWSKSVALTGGTVTAHDTSTTGLYPSTDAMTLDALRGAYSWAALSSVSQAISAPVGDEESTADATTLQSSVVSGDSSASVGTPSDILQTFSMAVSTSESHPISSSGQETTSTALTIPVAADSALSPASVVPVTSGGIIINLLFDAAAMAAPASFRAEIQQAATMLTAAISDQITVNLQIHYVGTGGGASAGPVSNVGGISYSSIRADLINGATPGDTTFNALPLGASIQGQPQVMVWNAQAKLFGLLGANDTTTNDGQAIFATDISQSVLVGVALHELTHALGRVSWGPQPDIFDLFRFTSTSAGTSRLFQSGNTTQPSYFSIDGGITKLADYGRTSDSSDFFNAGVQGPTDPFNEIYSGGTIQQLTPVDLQQLDALGFHTTSPPSTLSPDLVANTVSLGSSNVVAGGSTTFSYRVQDSGTGLAGASTSKVYLSTDATITSSDTLLGSINDVALAAGAFATDNMSITLPGSLAAGTYYLGVIADANNQVIESNENNNTAALQIAVSAPVSAPAPTVAITIPGGLTNHPTQTVSGTVDLADAGSTVTLYDGNTALGTTTVQSNGSWSKSITLTGDGSHTLTATDTNAAGMGTSNAVIFTLDTTPPTLSSLVGATDTGVPHANVGDVITIHMTTSEAVTVIGTPALQLNDNEVAAYTDGSATNTLTFTYVVQSSDFTPDLQVTALNLSPGASIQDTAGNNLSAGVIGDLGITLNDASTSQIQPSQIQAENLAIIRTTLPLDQATSIANSINSGAQTEAQFITDLLSKVADTTIPAVAVEGSMYGAVGSSAEVTLLATQFLPAQVANATQHGYNPVVYASEALGLVFAFSNEDGGKAFATNFGPSNAAMPNSTAGDAAFAAAAASAIFGPAATAHTPDAIQGFVSNWKAFYTSNGVSSIANPTAAQIDLAARGAAWGDAVGVALADNLGPLNGQAMNFLEDAAQGSAIYSASLSSQPSHAQFQGANALAALAGNELVNITGIATHLDTGLL